MVDPATGGVAAAAGYLFKMFSWTSKDFPPCNAKPLKEGRGWPWNQTVICHTTLEGDITIRCVKADEVAPKT